MNGEEKLLDELILTLQEHFGRIPTEDEIYGFIMGDLQQRDAIWNEEE